jgi:predicted nucleic acid-binding protein
MASHNTTNLLQELQNLNAPQLRRLLVEHLTIQRLGLQWESNAIGFADCAIAAIARTRGFALASRNVRDFSGCGIDLINPWAPV